MVVFLSKDLWPIVVLGGEHAHEAETSRAIKIPRIEKDHRNDDTSLQLLEQRESSVHRKQSAGSQNENDVPKRVRLIWHTRCHEINERRVLGKHRVYSL